jgi:uncharacterized protein YbaR (Trm112 family)
MKASQYVCVQCASPLQSTEQRALSCRQCGRTFPLLGPIPLLVSRPAAFLNMLAKTLREETRRRDQLAQQCEDDEKSGRLTAHAAERRRRQIAGMTANIELVRACVQNTGQMPGDADLAGLSLLEPRRKIIGPCVPPRSSITRSTGP